MPSLRTVYPRIEDAHDVVTSELEVDETGTDAFESFRSGLRELEPATTTSVGAEFGATVRGLPANDAPFTSMQRGATDTAGGRAGSSGASPVPACPRRRASSVVDGSGRMSGGKSSPGVPLGHG